MGFGCLLGFGEGEFSGGELVRLYELILWVVGDGIPSSRTLHLLPLRFLIIHTLQRLRYTRWTKPSRSEAADILFALGD